MQRLTRRVVRAQSRTLAQASDLLHWTSADDLKLGSVADSQSERETRYDPSLSATAVMREAERRHDVERLISGVSDTDWRVRLVAASSLGNLRDPRGITPLLKLLHTHDELLRSAAIKALADIGDLEVADDLFGVATEPGPYLLRFEAMLALARMGDGRGVDLVTATLIDPDLPSAIKKIPARFKGSVRVVRKVAARTLVDLSATQSIPRLEDAKGSAPLRDRVRLRRTIRQLRRGSLPSRSGGI